GQPLNTLSGGESQRLKLVKYLRAGANLKRNTSKSSIPDSGSSLILLDEPTTGLHKHDVKCLLAALQQIVDHGHSLIVIEHNLDVLKSADWIIELGPEAGSKGGRLVFQGSPAACAASAKTETGKYLARELESHQSLLAAENQANYGTKEVNGSSERELRILGAREHNLKNIDVSIPHYSLSVVTGVSGSGKSTLAFDIAFGEGQRRFMESMSPYARQFVEQLPRPDLDQLNGIQPTVAIEQRVTRGSRKSTVATITEVAQYLRLLYSRLGVPHNPDTGEPMLSQSAIELEKRLQSILRKPAVRKSEQLLLCSPVIRNRKGHHQPIANWIANHGYEMMRVDGEIILTEDFEKLDRYREHNIEIVIANLNSIRGAKAKIKSVLQEALLRGKGTALLLDDQEEIVSWLSTHRMDPRTGQALPELDPKDFSFNSSKGWCPTCRGHGRIYPWMREQLDDDELLKKSIGADASDDDESEEIIICPDCRGDRLNRTSRNVFLPLRANRWISLPQLLSLTPRALLNTLDRLKLDTRGKLIATDIVDQIRERLQFMDRVGLEYLSLDRTTQTLSGGEAQRIRLAAQLGSNLAGVLYILDEPSIGLHARDGDRLIDTLKSLRSKGNTLLVVEHDEAMMENADRIIDLGPGAGTQGGELIAEGTLGQLKRNRASLTGKYLKKGITHPIRGHHRKLPSRASDQNSWVELSGTNFRNLKNQSIRFPRERLIMVCGSSGAGKSSLVRDLLGNAAIYAIKAKKSNLSGKLFAKKGKPIEGEEGSILFAQLTGAHQFRSVLEVDQSPIGKTPRSTPATYLGVFDIIRQFFASLPEAKMRGYKPGRFSFNTPHGRCPTCSGAGRVKLEMSFMPDTYISCDKCKGRRYDAEIEDLLWNGKSIADVLKMSFEEAAKFFSFHTQLSGLMQLMVETGLGYIKLGQY
ncbi:MAG TPA: excinuclease ABC subunit A, partial [Opitutae bacterium]|nr:excinuclease ABC subunit A [Opitutae bacterium]